MDDFSQEKSKDGSLSGEKSRFESSTDYREMEKWYLDRLITYRSLVRVQLSQPQDRVEDKLVGLITPKLQKSNVWFNSSSCNGLFV